jgi:hypothetical protein
MNKRNHLLLSRYVLPAMARPSISIHSCRATAITR